jgi:hypothetical protein
MAWIVEFAEDFEPEFDAFPEAVQDELLAQAKVIEQFGPEAKRPRVDTLKGSKHANMQELRFDAADGVWRIAFAFDSRRRAVLLIGGDKSGGGKGASTSGSSRPRTSGLTPISRGSPPRN